MPDTIAKFEFSRPVHMIYFTEYHQYLEPQRGYSKSYFVEEFMQNEAGKFKFCDAIWHASYAYVDGTSYLIPYAAIYDFTLSNYSHYTPIRNHPEIPTC